MLEICDPAFDDHTKIAPLGAHDNSEVPDGTTLENLTGRNTSCTLKIVSLAPCSVTPETKPTDDTFVVALTNEVAESRKKHVIIDDVLPANGTSLIAAKNKQHVDIPRQIAKSTR